MLSFLEIVQASPSKAPETAKPKKDDSLSSFTSDEEAKPCKYRIPLLIIYSPKHIKES